MRGEEILFFDGEKIKFYLASGSGARKIRLLRVPGIRNSDVSVEKWPVRPSTRLQAAVKKVEDG
jgi:hypothetical protein